MFAGIDTHKDTLAVAVIDDGGAVIVHCEIPNEADGFEQLATMMRIHQVRRVGIEGSANFGWPASMHLLESGITVVEVPPLMTSRERMSRPNQGKTDQVDSIAIARITARETTLPPVRPMAGLPADLRVLTDYREDLVAERTALINQIHSDLGWLSPGYQHQLPTLTGRNHIYEAVLLLEGQISVRAAVTRLRPLRVLAIVDQLADLLRKIQELLQVTGTSLTDLYGIGPLLAARIIGEVSDIRRYPTRHHVAMANGTAPIPASSGRTTRYRLNRNGNRQLNRALYVMAITQLRLDDEGRAYYQRKRAEGKTGREALRCLKRRLSDVIYRTMRADLASADATPIPAAA